MSRVTFILGLAGSGKTHLAQRVSADTGAAFLEGIEGDQRVRLLATMIQHLKDGKDCVVEEIAYCSALFRDRIESEVLSQVPNAEIAWTCFENNLESANWNVQHRTNKGDVQGHLHINQCWHPRYTYPEGADIIPITRILVIPTSERSRI